MNCDKMDCDKNNRFTCSLNDALKFQQNDQLTIDQRLKFLYPFIDENVTPLPRALSKTDKSNFVNVTRRNPFRCEYTTPVLNYNNHDDVGAIRASNPIPPQCGIYYYEIEVICRGKYGKIAIGLTAKGTNLGRQPGWDASTFGYHGDDGRCFNNQGYGEKFGPTFGANDIIGCGLNLQNKTCFFTKNGNFLGAAFKDMPTISLYPTIGLHSKNEQVVVNFGQKPFKYNIKIEMILNDAHQLDVSTNSILDSTDSMCNMHSSKTKSQGILQHNYMLD